MSIDGSKKAIAVFLLLRGTPFIDESSTVIDSTRRLLSIKHVSTVVDGAGVGPSRSQMVIDSSDRRFSRFVDLV